MYILRNTILSSHLQNGPLNEEIMYTKLGSGTYLNKFKKKCYFCKKILFLILWIKTKKKIYYMFFSKVHSFRKKNH